MSLRTLIQNASIVSMDDAIGEIAGGDILIENDSILEVGRHLPTEGAQVIDATDMVAIVATGETWLSVPQTIRIEWSGAFGQGVTAKDVMLHLCRVLGMDNAFKAVEFAGPAVEAMGMPERMVLCNMAAELGAEAGVVAPDAVTFAYLAAVGAPVEDEAAALVGVRGGCDGLSLTRKAGPASWFRQWAVTKQARRLGPGGFRESR